ncbi:MAG: NTP transferase domain-containing protein [Methylotenera sp.]|nr:NTP transferase domain-containing protein [Oligoflexia bacterium]
MSPTKVTQAMVMAAGLGTRLRPFTDLVAKPMLPLMGIPMAQFAFDLLTHHGVKKIVANVSHLAAETCEGLRALDLGNTTLEISDESQCLLGSGGGIKKAAAHFGREPFFLLNSDVLCDVDLAELERHHARLRKEHGVLLTLAILVTGQIGSKYREILVDPATRLITGLGEQAEQRPYFVGVAIVEPEALRNVPAGVAEFVPSILLPALKAGKAGAFLMQECKWFDVGSPDLWQATHFSLIDLLEKGTIPELWKKRLLEANEKRADGGWSSKETQHSKSSHWKSPYYISVPDGAVEFCGPRAVFYATTPQTPAEQLVHEIENGIGFGGLWAPLK